MSFIHDLPGWPGLRYDLAALTTALATTRHKQGRLLGQMESLGFDLRIEAGVRTLTEEVVKSSAIESETLNPREVRSSIARRLGLETAGLPRPGRQVEGVVEMMLDATRNARSPLTRERLFDWHAALFPTGRSGMHRITVAAFRSDSDGPMQVVSGPIGRQRVHFQAPDASRLPTEVDRFLAWLDAPPAIDPVLIAGIAHFWFVTLHPFDDGNGRMARAIAELALTRSDGCSERFYSMSAGIEAERSDYYRQLESSQRGTLDITTWLAWFLGCLERSLDRATDTLATIRQRARVWQSLQPHPLNERQRTVITRLLDNWTGHLNTSKYARLTGCSRDTALRDIRELLAIGALLQNPGGGRSTSYRLALPPE